MGSFFDVASLQAYRQSLVSKKPLGREEERELARRYLAGEKRAGDKLVEACLSFVITIDLE